MADRFQTGSYPLAYQSNYPNQYSNRVSYGNQVAKQRNIYNIKESNISQQTIIHKAHLYSPDKNQQRFQKNNVDYQFQNSNLDRTKAKKNQIGLKINEITDMCQNDHQAEVQQFRDVMQAERGILDRLKQTNQKIENKVPNIDLSNFGDGHYDRGTTFGPIRNPTPLISKIQSRQISPRHFQSHSNPHYQQQYQQSRQQQQIQGRQNGPRDYNIYKKSAIDDLKTDRNADEPAQSSNFQNHVRRISEQNRPLNDETEMMIQQIQRKAMQQIESLRNDKIDLMRKLNEQVRMHNQEKKFRMRLEADLAKLKGVHYKPTSPRTQNIVNVSHQRPQSLSSQTYFPPPLASPHIQFIEQDRQSLPSRPQSPQGYARAQQRQYINAPSHTSIPYQNQINRLQAENSNLIRTLRSGTKQYNEQSVEKDQLRQQIAHLNQLINRYRHQIQRLRQTQKNNGVHNDKRQLEQLLSEGQRIETDTLKLLRQNAQEQSNQYNQASRINARISKRLPTSQDIIQDANTFKRILVETDNLRSNKSIGIGGRQNSQNFIYGPIRSNKNLYASSNDNKYSDFERILGDLKNAAY